MLSFLPSFRATTQLQMISRAGASTEVEACPLTPALYGGGHWQCLRLPQRIERPALRATEDRIRFDGRWSGIKNSKSSKATSDKLRVSWRRRSVQSFTAVASTLQQATSSLLGSGKASPPEAGPSRPAHWANDSGTLFRNPWPDSSAPPAWNELAWPVAWKKPASETARRIAVQHPDFGQAALALEPGTLRTTWLGHATVLLQIPLAGRRRSSFHILADPVCSARAGPTQFTGIKRALNPPCAVHDLPDIDAVVISHNHYDHLDHSSIMQIHQLFPTALYFVPLRLGKWLVQSGIPSSSIRELDWWQQHDLAVSSELGLDRDSTDQKGDDLGGLDGGGGGSLRFTCVPAQHNSGRAPGDAGHTLWCGWVLEHFTNAHTRASCAYFAGDTGYRRFASSQAVCPVFKDIGHRFGPIDLSFLPIWRGGTLGFVSYTGFSLDHNALFVAHHSTPKDAVDLHQDVRSRCSIPIHFATFVGSVDETLEATSELAEACEQAGVSTNPDANEQQQKDQSRFPCLDIGQQYTVACVPKTVALE